MKNYDNLMQKLRFREDFCEETLQKAQKQTKKRIPRALIVAACICLSAAMLIGTALAVPQLRELIFTNQSSDSVPPRVDILEKYEDEKEKIEKEIEDYIAQFEALQEEDKILMPDSSSRLKNNLE